MKKLQYNSLFNTYFPKAVENEFSNDYFFSMQLYEHQLSALKLYEICYDEKKRKILYAQHKIHSEKLLTSKLLFREREFEYHMMTDAILPLSNYDELEKAANKVSFLTHYRPFHTIYGFTISKYV